MSNKIIVCRCEDVTLFDIEEAVAHGYRDIEEVKRYTGLGTGPCQGKECLVQTCRLLYAAQQAAGRPEDRPEEPIAPRPFTVRPPVYSVALGALARGGEAPKR